MRETAGTFIPQAAKDSDANRPCVVLLGAGHAHLHLIARAEEFSRRGFRLVVVSPEDFWYSGLATGMLGGRYAASEDQVDIARLLAGGGEACRFLRSRAVGIDPVQRIVRLEDRSTLRYDVLSVDVGSEVRPVAGETQNVYPIKPLSELDRLRQDLLAARSAGKILRVVIVGGGTSGCEIAANVRALVGEIGTVTILARGPSLGSALPGGAQQALTKWLASRNIGKRVNCAVLRIEKGSAWLEDGGRVEFDFLVNATGLHPPEFLASGGLTVTERGELEVDQFLRSVSDGRVFGGGDCVAMGGRELAKVGVHAVRQGPVLLHNVIATLTDRPLRAYRPQRHCLLIMNLGEGVGLAHWRSWHWLGRTSFWLKDRIDRGFLSRYGR